MLNMKASDILEGALKAKYSPTLVNYGKGSAFMCNALDDYVADLLGSDYTAANVSQITDPIKGLFIGPINRNNYCTLMQYMLARIPAYKEAYGRNMLNHYSVECFELRVKWFERVIKKLRKQNL